MTPTRRSPGHWAGVALVGLIALIASWLIVRSTLQGLLGPEYPLLAVSLAPTSADAEAAVALNRVSRAGGQVDARSRTLARDALARSPLLATPLVIAGLDASLQDDAPRARTLFAAAAQRDPRSVIARYWLFDDSLQRGDYAGGVAQAGPIVRLQPAAAIAVATVLTALVDVPAARPVLAAALRRMPSWRRAFVQQVRATPRLAAAAAPLFGTVDGRAALLTSLVRAGRADQAYALWRNGLPAAPPAGVYDGRFLGLPGSPPFNWRLIGERLGNVSRRPGGGLNIHTPDNNPHPLAEQTVLLAAGAHRLQFELRATAEEDADGRLRATVRCATGAAILARGTFDPTAGNERSLPVVTPPDCRVMLVQFAVVPGMTPGAFAATLDHVRLSGRS